MPFIDLNTNTSNSNPTAVNPVVSVNPASLASNISDTNSTNPAVSVTLPLPPLPVNPIAAPIVPEMSSGVRETVGASWSQTAQDLNKVQTNLSNAIVDLPPVTLGEKINTLDVQTSTLDSIEEAEPRLAEITFGTELANLPTVEPIAPTAPVALSVVEPIAATMPIWNKPVESLQPNVPLARSSWVAPEQVVSSTPLSAWQANTTNTTQAAQVAPTTTQVAPSIAQVAPITTQAAPLRVDPEDIEAELELPAFNRQVAPATPNWSKPTEAAEPIKTAWSASSLGQQTAPVATSLDQQPAAASLNQPSAAYSFGQQPAAPSFEQRTTPTVPSFAQQQTAPSLNQQPVESTLPKLDQLAPKLAAVEQPFLQSKSYTLNELLKQAVKDGASDLHLTADYRAMIRVDGKLVEIQSQILTHQDIMSMLEEVAVGHPYFDLKHDLDIDVSYELENPAARFRVNIFYQRNTIGAVFRLIPSRIRTVEELKLPPVVKEFTGLPAGLVLVTGPTGSGKTTTLAALVNSINTSEPKHIITIEDPIEYVYPKGVGLVDQRAVYIDTPDWHTALRAVLRQDPNVVMIGEMRDMETMEAALTIAETGHLVFSTLHTNSAAQTIDRIIDAFPEAKQAQVRSQLASVLMAVVSQRLVPVSGGGRRVVAEIMVVTPAVRNSIREQKVYQIDNIIQTSAELGMITMEKSLVNLIREGAISPEVAQNFANRPEEILSYLSKN